MRISIVLPAYNEEQILKENIRKLDSFLKANFKYVYEIIIGDNGSTDNTLNIAKELSRNYKNISFFRLNKKGRGRIIKEIWLNCNSDIVSYMDADLSADLSTFPTLIDQIITGYDIAIGSRFFNGSYITRGLFRYLLSKIYNLCVRSFLSIKTFSDTQCGFKTMRTSVAKRLIPKIKNNNWFFDTELLCLSEKEGYKIKEVPVSWIERRPSKVNLLAAICEDLLGLLRLRIYIRKNYK